MLKSLPIKTKSRAPLWAKALWIALFTALTVVSARATIELGTPVPITLQTMVIMLAGMVLGARDGAISQLAYLGLIAANLPVDSRMLGAAAFVGSTAGFLIGFPVLAYITGWLSERREQVWLRWLAGVVGTGALYLLGSYWLKLSTGMVWAQVFAVAVQPFIVIDLLKALIAAGLSEGGRAALNRYYNA